MARITWSSPIDNLIATVEGAEGIARDEALAIVQESVQIGADEMYNHIERLDRIDTGRMINAVNDSTATPIGGRYGGAEGTFGWGVNGEETEDYFYYQEKGFTHTSGKKIPPMHALLAGFIKAREHMNARVAALAAGGKLWR